MEQRRATGFLLGLILVLAVFYVALEWNSVEATDDIDPIDLTDLMHESELVPMSNEDIITQLEEKQPSEQGEKINIVDDDVEVEVAEEETGDEDEQLLKELEEEQDDKALAPLTVDPNNPLNFHVVEDLPQYPGGAVEFLKWLTRNLRYPTVAKNNKTQGKVVAVFYVEKDGSITHIEKVRGVESTLSEEEVTSYKQEHPNSEEQLEAGQDLGDLLFEEAKRVLELMPKWEPAKDEDGNPVRSIFNLPVMFRLQ